jgi:hypothetical protein
MTIPTTPLEDGAGQDSQPLLWDHAAEAREMLGLWSSAWGVWGDYLGRLGASPGPLEVFAAGEQLMADSFQICGRVVSGRLRDGGVRAPLLNDA